LRGGIDEFSACRVAGVGTVDPLQERVGLFGEAPSVGDEGATGWSKLLLSGGRRMGVLSCVKGEDRRTVFMKLDFILEFLLLLTVLVRTDASNSGASQHNSSYQGAERYYSGSDVGYFSEEEGGDSVAKSPFCQ
jgi:hypothetical protein